LASPASEAPREGPLGPPPAEGPALVEPHGRQSPAEGPAPATPRGRLARTARSFGYAFEGLASLLRTQPNFLVHILAAAAALGLGLVLRLSLAELALLVLTIGLVLVVEAVNTALESMCDLVSPSYHPLIKRAKDVGAAAVLIAALAAVAVALLLFIPRLASLISST
jgi:diacylglycerol kinase